LDSAIICEGVNIPTEELKSKTNTLCIDSNGKFRHIGCSLIVNKELTINRLKYNKIFSQCKFCKIALIRCQRKKLGIKCTPVVKRVRLLYTPSKLEKLKLLRQRNKNIKELNRRAGKQLNKLKSQLKICEEKFSNLDESTILQNLTSNNITQN